MVTVALPRTPLRSRRAANSKLTGAVRSSTGSTSSTAVGSTERPTAAEMPSAIASWSQNPMAYMLTRLSRIRSIRT